MTKKDKEEKQESEHKRIISKTVELYNPWNITGLTIGNEEKEPPEYEAISNNDEEDKLLTEEERNQQRTRDRTPSRTSEESPERNNNTLPPHVKLNETVNFLGEGRNVADTLGSVHTRHETPICQESTMQNNTLSL